MEARQQSAFPPPTHPSPALPRPGKGNKSLFLLSGVNLVSPPAILPLNYQQKATSKTDNIPKSSFPASLAPLSAPPPHLLPFPNRISAPHANRLNALAVADQWFSGSVGANRWLMLLLLLGVIPDCGIMSRHLPPLPPLAPSFCLCSLESNRQLSRSSGNLPSCPSPGEFCCEELQLQVSRCPRCSFTAKFRTPPNHPQTPTLPEYPLQPPPPLPLRPFLTRVFCY